MTAVIMFAVVVLIYGLYRLRLADLDRLQAYEEAAKEFHQAAAALVADDETPDAVLDVIEVLNKKMSNPSSAREIFRFFLASRRSMRRGQSPRLVEIRAFFARRPELERKFIEALCSALLAMSYRSRLCGAKLRIWMTTIETPEKKEQIATSYSEYVGQDAIAA